MAARNASRALHHAIRNTWCQAHLRIDHGPDILPVENTYLLLVGRTAQTRRCQPSICISPLLVHLRHHEVKRFLVDVDNLLYLRHAVNHINDGVQRVQISTAPHTGLRRTPGWEARAKAAGPSCYLTTRRSYFNATSTITLTTVVSVALLFPRFSTFHAPISVTPPRTSGASKATAQYSITANHRRGRTCTCALIATRDPKRWGPRLGQASKAVVFLSLARSPRGPACDPRRPCPLFSCAVLVATDCITWQTLAGVASPISARDTSVRADGNRCWGGDERFALGRGVAGSTC